MFSAFLALIADLLEKVGLAYWRKHEAQEKAQRAADVPVTDDEWLRDAHAGDL